MANSSIKNKQHEYILRAFLESRIPDIIRSDAPELIAVDSAIGGYCTQLITDVKSVKLPRGKIISENAKYTFSELINKLSGVQKNELVFYYRLAILTESVLFQYQQ